MPVGDEIVVVPHAMAAGGNAIAREGEGRVVFVTGALPGERVRVVITESKRDYSRASLLEVEKVSPSRVEVRCAHAIAGCGGCGWLHADLTLQRAMKRDIVLDALRRTGKLNDEERANLDLANGPRFHRPGSEPRLAWPCMTAVGSGFGLRTRTM